MEETVFNSTSVNNPLLQKYKKWIILIAPMTLLLQTLSLMSLELALVSMLRMTLKLETLLVSKFSTVMDSSKVSLSFSLVELAVPKNITSTLPQCALLELTDQTTTQPFQLSKTTSKQVLAITLSCMIPKPAAQSSVSRWSPDSSTSTRTSSVPF